MVGFLIYIGSCSFLYDPIIPYELERYVDEFIYEGAKRGVHINKDRIKVKYKDLDNGGRGIHHPLGRHTVIISTRIIDYYRVGDYGEWQMRWLMFHELGHATMRRGHKNHKVNHIEEDLTGFYRYASIMAQGQTWYMTHPNRNYFKEFYSDLMDEMFNYGEWKYK